VNAYRELKDGHQKEVNEFPFFFAFSDEQFNKGMAGFGLKPDETDKIYKFGSTGGFYLRTDSERLKEMMERHEKEMLDAIVADETGEGFILDMFNYELANHEYIITGSVEETLDALGLTWKDIKRSEKLMHGLAFARKNQREQMEAAC